MSFDLRGIVFFTFSNLEEVGGNDNFFIFIF